MPPKKPAADPPAQSSSDAPAKEKKSGVGADGSKSEEPFFKCDWAHYLKLPTNVKPISSQTA